MFVPHGESSALILAHIPLAGLKYIFTPHPLGLSRQAWSPALCTHPWGPSFWAQHPGGQPPGFRVGGPGPAPRAWLWLLPPLSVGFSNIIFLASLSNTALCVDSRSSSPNPDPTTQPK